VLGPAGAVAVVVSVSVSVSVPSVSTIAAIVVGARRRLGHGSGRDHCQSGNGGGQVDQSSHGFLLVFGYSGIDVREAGSSPTKTRGQRLRSGSLIRQPRGM
jgi:hypothetical protein